MSYLSSAISAFVQLGLVLVLPLAWWALAARRTVAFLTWIGLRRPTWRASAPQLACAALSWVFVGLVSIVLLQSLSRGEPASRFAGSGLAGVVPVLLFAIIQTSLAEEIFFRGFLGKRLIARWGFGVGNAVQAVVFGLLHIALFASIAGPIQVVLIGAATAASGWMTGWINEKGAEGSIIPGWLLHATANLIVGLGTAFNLLA